MLHAIRRAFVISAGPAAALAALGLFWGAYAAWLPDVKARAGLDDATMGLALLGAACGNIVAMTIFPRLARVFGTRLLSGAAVALAAASLLQLAGGGAVGLFLALFGMGFVMAMVDVGANVRLTVLEARHGMALMNLAHGLYSLAFAVSAALAGIARGAGLAQTVVVAVMAATILAASRMMTGRLDGGKGDGGGAVARVPWPVVLPAALMLFAGFVAENATETWSALHIERELGAARGGGTAGPAMMGLMMAVGRLGGQAAAMRWGEARLVAVSTLVAIAGALTLALAPTQTLAVAGVALIGLGVAVIAPSSNSLLGRRVAPGTRPLAISRVWMLGFSGFFMGPVFMGTMAEGVGLGAGFLGVAAMLTLILAGLAALMRHPVKD